jgi:hypothetical protein
MVFIAAAVIIITALALSCVVWLNSKIQYTLGYKYAASKLQEGGLAKYRLLGEIENVRCEKGVGSYQEGMSNAISDYDSRL